MDSTTDSAGFGSAVFVGLGHTLHLTQAPGDTFERWMLGSSAPEAGAHPLTSTGLNSTGGGSASGNSGVSPMPEAETYASMVAGLLAMGALILRRRG